MADTTNETKGAGNEKGGKLPETLSSKQVQQLFEEFDRLHKERMDDFMAKQAQEMAEVRGEIARKDATIEKLASLAAAPGGGQAADPDAFVEGKYDPEDILDPEVILFAPRFATAVAGYKQNGIYRSLPVAGGKVEFHHQMTHYVPGLNGEMLPRVVCTAKIQSKRLLEVMKNPACGYGVLYYDNANVAAGVDPTYVAAAMRASQWLAGIDSVPEVYALAHKHGISDALTKDVSKIKMELAAKFAYAELQEQMDRLDEQRRESAREVYISGKQ